MQAWCDDFFDLISKHWVFFSHFDEKTQMKLSLDITRICIRTSYKGNIYETFLVLIDRKSFEIFLTKDSYCACVVIARSNSEEDDKELCEFGEDGYVGNDFSEGERDESDDRLVSNKGTIDTMKATRREFKGTLEKGVESAEYSMHRVLHNKVFLGSCSKSVSGENYGEEYTNLLLRDPSSQALNAIKAEENSCKGSRMVETQGFHV